MAWNARWFDGRDSTPHLATVELAGGEVVVSLGEAALYTLQYPLADVQVGEVFSGTPCRLQLPDGSALAVEDDPDGTFETALRGQGVRRGFASRLVRSTPAALACLGILLALLVWLDRQGAGLIASLALPVVPHSVDQRLGAAAGQILEKQWLVESEIPESRQERLFDTVDRMVRAQHPDLAWDLQFRGTPDQENAFNAFTLPGGTIVLLDGLTLELSNEQVIAVVGHELGHAVHRHSMQRLLRQLGLLAATGVVLGDVSTMAAGLAAGYQDLHYSRDAEREADQFAIEFLRRGNIPVKHLAEAFEVMKTWESGAMPAFLSSHPQTEERLRLAREAAAR